MTKVIGVRFKANGKSYYFSPGELELQQGDHVIVETARGTECGEVAKGPHDVPDSSIVKPLKTVTRMADAVDVRRMQQNRADEKRAFSVCEERIAKHKLDMKLVDVEYTLDRNKIDRQGRGERCASQEHGFPQGFPSGQGRRQSRQVSYAFK